MYVMNIFSSFNFHLTLLVVQVCYFNCIIINHSNIKYGSKSLPVSPTPHLRDWSLSISKPWRFSSNQLHSTGVTGYIGGDGLYAVANAHPDWEYSALVRNKEKAARLAEKYPQIRIVLGDLDSSDIIEEEVKNADIVFRK